MQLCGPYVQTAGISFLFLSHFFSFSLPSINSPQYYSTRSSILVAPCPPFILAINIFTLLCNSGLLFFVLPLVPQIKTLTLSSYFLGRFNLGQKFCWSRRAISQIARNIAHYPARRQKIPDSFSPARHAFSFAPDPVDELTLVESSHDTTNRPLLDSALQNGTSKRNRRRHNSVNFGHQEEGRDRGWRSDS